MGWEHAGQILTSLVNNYTQATRIEENNAWCHPIDLVSLLEDAFVKLPSAIASGQKIQFDPGEVPLVEMILDENPDTSILALLNALSAGATPVEIAREVVFTAALGIARFQKSNEFGDWNTALHTFTFANAVYQGFLRVAPGENETYPLLLRRVFDAAMSVYLDRFLNVPAARVPEGLTPKMQ